MKILSRFGRALDVEESECLLEEYEVKDDINSRKINLQFLSGLGAPTPDVLSN